MPAPQPQYKLPIFICLFLLGVTLTQVFRPGVFNFNNEGNNSQVVAQSSPKPTPQIIVQAGEVRPLPGKLDNIPVFNSNSPEWVKQEGILLSTFPPNGKKVPGAHLNFPFQGRFDLFAHHYTHTPKDLQTLYLGVMLYNPGKKPVTVDVLQAASYLLKDAPFATLAPYIENNDGKAFSGPGARAVSDVLRGVRQAEFPAKLIIPPGQSRLLLNHGIEVRNLAKPVNGRSTFMRLRSSGKVYAASLAMYAKKNPDGSDRSPTLTEWQALLNNGNFAGPRDKTPTPPNATGGVLIYGRVAGVSSGSQWQAVLTDNTKAQTLTIPQRGEAISYAIGSLRGGQLGSGQIQTAKMLVRYPDTAYEAHGNYGVEYNLTLPLSNNTKENQKVSVTLETPLKEDKLSQGGLRFRQPSLDFPFFRGTVRLRYLDEQGQQKTRYVHLWHRTGQVLEPLLQLNLAPGSQRRVQVDLIYPPDSTPPQVLTVRTVI
ncbi:DUF3370 domain-containing protein [Calothrix sp. FACHB-1219]|uniref:DUF3370 domain-containing protein n=1 Tax=unclassified Calothrix TaxID=2619626 RepID=UPI0016856B41|nr:MULTISPECIES: DUF3370 domain-containing protein [unclassified Calothrix]MBD2206903.1 DUF3370 domain-containing protein [Calothrix sp. FACHB-168]MBD2221521.1 DUF3370 domain-containing protein [Calothrix sp. FACHB-1219]